MVAKMIVAHLLLHYDFNLADQDRMDPQLYPGMKICCRIRSCVSFYMNALRNLNSEEVGWKTLQLAAGGLCHSPTHVHQTVELRDFSYCKILQRPDCCIKVNCHQGGA